VTSSFNYYIKLGVIKIFYKKLADKNCRKYNFGKKEKKKKNYIYLSKKKKNKCIINKKRKK